jgi:hypothetical protein
MHIYSMTADSTIHVGLQEMNTNFLFSAHNWKQKKAVCTHSDKGYDEPASMT